MKIVYANSAINPEEVIRFLSLTGQSHPVFREIIKRKEVMKKAKELSIEVSDEQLQHFSDNFRMVCGLHSAKETLNFLEDSGLSEEDFEAFCESTLLIDALKERLADEQKIQEYFVNNRSELDLARISIIDVKEENLANEIMMQVKEDGEDFHALARRHSLDQRTKYLGGHVGLVSRDMLSAEVTAKVFNAEPGGLIGPFKRNNLYEIILVEEVIKAELNENVKEGIKERIFEEWVCQFLKGGVQICL